MKRFEASILIRDKFNPTIDEDPVVDIIITINIEAESLNFAVEKIQNIYFGMFKEIINIQEIL